MTAIAALSWRARGRIGGLDPPPGVGTPRPGDAVINMGRTGDTPASGDTTTNKDKKQETLFGPSIGIVNTGPKWAEIDDKKIVNDQLTPDIVKSWITKSKDATQPTTTLQALVNLKRPTLRLSPLTQDATEDADTAQADAQNLHGLEFEYDCDASKCGIYVYALLAPDHPEADSANIIPGSGLCKTLVFESVTDGGFGRVLKLEEGAVLELGKFDRKLTSKSKDASTASLGVDPAAPSTSVSEEPAQRHKRRFTRLNLRKRFQGRSAAGPALAVVDDPAATAGTPAGGENVDGDAPDGVKVVIKLAALDDQGVTLPSVNEQNTFLHVFRFGERPEGEGAEDARPWVVKVVKREATIGPHTFHLHEIYGLSSASTSAPMPTAPLPSPTHEYPPATPQVADTNYAENAASECLVCLSSPREVVLLPCRHLVACKECAINMVEFGAGGQIVHADAEPAEATPPAPASDTTTPAAEGGAAPTATAAAPTTPQAPTATTAAPTTQRRKRRAKGWFCPVCRQPYTSLLRLTTNPPEIKSKETPSETSPTPAVKAEEVTTERGGGIPGFFRSLSARATGNNSSNADQDVERNAAAPAAASPATPTVVATSATSNAAEANTNTNA